MFIQWYCFKALRYRGHVKSFSISVTILLIVPVPHVASFFSKVSRRTFGFAQRSTSNQFFYGVFSLFCIFLHAYILLKLSPFRVYKLYILPLIGILASSQGFLAALLFKMAAVRHLGFTRLKESGEEHAEFDFWATL